MGGGRESGADTCDGVIEQADGEKNEPEEGKEKKMMLFFSRSAASGHSHSNQEEMTSTSCQPSRSELLHH